MSYCPHLFEQGNLHLEAELYPSIRNVVKESTGQGIDRAETGSTSFPEWHIRSMEQDKLARWIVGLGNENEADEATSRFVDAVKVSWPRVLAHAGRELSRQGLSQAEIKSLTLEIWEDTLRSVWKTLQQDPGANANVKHLENYLIGTFHHRFNRNLKRKRLHNAVVEFLPPEELIGLSGINYQKHDWEDEIQRVIQLEQVYAEMDADTRKALIAKVYGFSWLEIANTFQIEEQNLIMRVQYAIKKVREKFCSRRSKLKMVSKVLK